jgi:hypothetical protein
MRLRSAASVHCIAPPAAHCPPPAPPPRTHPPHAHPTPRTPHRTPGDLSQLGAAFAASPINFIALLDLSANQLAGPVPDSFSKLALFDASRRDLVGGAFQQLPRVLNLSGNAFSGAFPAYVLTRLPPVVRFCARSQCTAAAAVAGPDMRLVCPAAAEVRGQADFSLLSGMALECLDPEGRRVQAVEHVGGGGPDGGGGGGGGAGARAGGGAGLGGGAVAGLVLGLLVLLAALAALAYFVGYRRFSKEQRARSFQKFEAAEAAAAGAKGGEGAEEAAGTAGQGPARDAPV